MKKNSQSIYSFLDEKIDSGDIIVKKKFKIEDEDNFNSIVDKNYIVAKGNN